MQKHSKMSARIVTMKKSDSGILLSACFNHTFPTDAVTCQCTDGGIQYILVEQIHNAQLQKCLKKNTEHALRILSKLVLPFLGVEMTDSSTETHIAWFLLRTCKPTPQNL
jgi:hypothetical protein